MFRRAESRSRIGAGPIFSAGFSATGAHRLGLRLTRCRGLRFPQPLEPHYAQLRILVLGIDHSRISLSAAHSCR